MVEEDCSVYGDQEAEKESEEPGTKYNTQGHSPSDLLPLPLPYLPRIPPSNPFQIMNSSNGLIP